MYLWNLDDGSVASSAEGHQSKIVSLSCDAC